MATFDFFKAIWKNGPGVVSDAPAWVLDEIERELPIWMSAHEREFVGVHLCVQSNLVLGILVSPSASGGDGSLENARHGSFIHVFATDHPDRATLRVDEVRELFESTYGSPISDGTVRQQRNFMLLDYPYHVDLAKDLFIEKDRVEGDLDFGALSAPSEFEETLADPVPPYVPHEEPASRPLPQGSLSSLLSHHDPVVPSREEEGGLPFDQGDSYAEVIAGLRQRLYGRSYAFESAQAVDDPPTPEQSAPTASLPLTVDTPPFDQPAPVMRTVPDTEAAEAESGVAHEEETELELRRFEAIPVLDLDLEHDASLVPRRRGAPVYAVVVLLVAGLLVGGAIALRFWERAPVDASLADRELPVAPLPPVAARLPGRERVEPDRRIDALEKESPALQPLAPLSAVEMPAVKESAVEVASIEVVTEEVKPDLPLIEPVMPPVIAPSGAEADLTELAAVKTKGTPEAVVRGAASGLEPTRSLVTSEPVPVMAQVEVVTEPELVMDEEISSASGGPAPANSIETGAETDVDTDSTSIVVERETKQREGRRKRERKRIMGQINRYR